MKTFFVVVSLSLIGAVAAFAEGPYAGMQTRSIKALSDQIVVQASEISDARWFPSAEVASSAELRQPLRRPTPA